MKVSRYASCAFLSGLPRLTSWLVPEAPSATQRLPIRSSAIGFITTSSTRYSTKGGTPFARPITTSMKCPASGLGFFKGSRASIPLFRCHVFR